ncbi:MAG: winged helix-turn-helix domain-containing protein [Acidobacteriota bacterium]
MTDTSRSTLFFFGPFTLDLAKRILLHADENVSLTAKQFEVLEYMVRNPGRVLSKQEILQAVWPDSFVEEGSLTQTVFWIRKALRNGDLDDQERYILTVQGRGYRFIAEVMEPQAATEALATTEPDVAVAATQPTIAVHSQFVRRHTRSLIAAGVLLLLGAGVYVWQRPKLSHQFYDPVANPEVIITQIENATGDATLTPVINSVLRRGLSQSPYVVIVPRVEINKTLGYMNLPATTAITSQNAQAICIRRNSTDTIETSVTPQGAGFLITLEAINCVTGKAQSVGRASAASKDQILIALDSLLPQLRRNLGETSNSIRQFSVPVENATTASLEAFKAFLEAEDLRMKGETVKAIPFFQRALLLDPNFAFAHLGLGTCYQTANQRDASIAEFTKANELASRVSARERFSIEYFYTKIVRGDLPASIGLNDAWAARYFRDMAPYTNGTDTFNQLDRSSDAIAYGEKGIRLYPDGGLTYVALGQAYLRTGRYDDMKRIGADAVSRHIDGWQLHEMLWQRAYLANDKAAAASERAWVNGTADEYLAIADDVLLDLRAGDVSAALAAQQRFVTAATVSGAQDLIDATSCRNVFYLHEMGFDTQARAAMVSCHPANATPEFGLALASMAKESETLALVAKLSNGHEQDTLIQQWYVPTIRATLALHSAGEPGAQKALDALRTAEPLNLHDFTAYYLRGKAYLAMHKGVEAAQAFQHVVDNPGADPFSPLYSLSVLGLARAQAMHS